MTDRNALVTVAAVAACVYIAANVGHEAVGHGVTCVAVGGQLNAIQAVYVDCDYDALSTARQIAVKAAGTTVNLLLFVGSFWLLRRRRGVPSVWGYALWLSTAVNGLQAAGYWMFSGILGVGDWAGIADRTPFPVPARIALALSGCGAYWWVTRLALRELQPFVGGEGSRAAWSKRLCLVPYFTGGLLYVAAGLLNPESPMLVLISAAAASFGGTSALTWAHDLPDKWRWPVAATRLHIPQLAHGWVIAAVLLAVAFIAVLGPAIRF